MSHELTWLEVDTEVIGQELNWVCWLQQSHVSFHVAWSSHSMTVDSKSEDSKRQEEETDSLLKIGPEM